MEISKKKLTTMIGISVVIAILLTAFIMTEFSLTEIYGNIHFSFSVSSIHMTTSFYKDGVLISKQYHAGAVTNFGLNQTFAKLTGNNTFYSLTYYLMNLTYVGIGNQGTLNIGSTILPGEWNRTLGSQHALVYNGFNITVTIYPDDGDYTADCMGLYLNATGNCLWGYDTRDEVTGIDSTFVIIIEIEVSAS